MAEYGTAVAGYGYCTLYRTRSAYRYALEDSIYVRHDMLGRGVGKALLAELIRRCEGLGYRQLIAVIGDSANAGSIGLHASLGFLRVGHAALGRLQVRPLGRQRDHAAPARRG